MTHPILTVEQKLDKIIEAQERVDHRRAVEKAADERSLNVVLREIQETKRVVLDRMEIVETRVKGIEARVERVEDKMRSTPPRLSRNASMEVHRYNPELTPAGGHQIVPVDLLAGVREKIEELEANREEQSREIERLTQHVEIEKATRLALAEDAEKQAKADQNKRNKLHTVIAVAVPAATLLGWILNHLSHP